jgi:polyisoprenoid-binding protein YceI
MAPRRPSLQLLVALALSLAVVSVAPAAVHEVRPGGATQVVFVSKAPTETFEGRTRRMQGTIDLDPAAVGDSVRFRLEVDTRTLDTGSRLRDQHMHERYLETQRFPTAVFEGGRVVQGAGQRIAAGAETAFRVAGSFTLHGVTRPMVCDVMASLDGSGRLVFRAEFPVRLADHGIERPEMLFLKLAETQRVRVSAIASSRP